MVKQITRDLSASQQSKGDLMDWKLQLVLLLGFSIWGIVIVLFVWALGFTEFSYLGKSGIQFLYNCFSSVYNFKWQSKSYSSEETTEQLFLKPLQQALKESEESQMLDLACGTGRMSLMILNSNWFKGTIQAFDFSEGMLKIFRGKVLALGEEKQNRIALFEQDLSKWKTKQTAQFNVVTLTEAGEFLPNFKQIVENVSQSLKPGGLFLLTKPPDFMTWAYPGRAQSSNELKELLTQNGFENIQIHKWTRRYEVVWAFKA